MADTPTAIVILLHSRRHPSSQSRRGSATAGQGAVVYELSARRDRKRAAAAAPAGDAA